MKKIGFIDYFLSEWHANSYPEMIKKNCEKSGRDYEVAYAWAEVDKSPYDGINDVEELITGFIRTDKASITFNGAWAQNIDIPEMYIDFMGDKGGVRMMYNGPFTIFTNDGKMFQTITPDYNNADMFYDEDDAFLQSVLTGEKSRSNIEYVLPSAQLLDAIYLSGEEGKEIVL